MATALALGDIYALRLELRFEGELILPWNVVRIVCGDRAKGVVAKRLVSDVGVVDVEIRRVGDVKGFDTELQVYTLRNGEVFEKRERSTWRKSGPNSELRCVFPIVPRG
jgi:hypothetical protein